MTEEDAEETRARLGAELNHAFESSDAIRISKAIAEALREFNITRVAEQSGLSRPTVHRAFTSADLPRLSTVLAVLDAIGFRLRIEKSKSSSWRANLARKSRR